MLRGRVFALVALVGVSLTLTACTPRDPVFARLTDGRFEVMICTDIAASEISVEMAPEGTLDYKTVWIAQGNTEFREGDVVEYGVPPKGWVNILGPDPLDIDTHATNFWVGDKIPHTGEIQNVLLDGTSVLGGGWIGEWLDGGDWVDSGGTSVEPCGTQ